MVYAIFICQTVVLLNDSRQVSAMAPKTVRVHVYGPEIIVTAPNTLPPPRVSMIV